MRSRTWLLAFAVVIFAANVWRYHDYLLDDAFISFRYAKNLVAGHGLVYNVGERVEGYTDFLFVIASAGLMALGLDPIAGTRLLSFAFALAILFLVSQLERPGSSTGVSLLLLLATPAFAYWAVASFETMMFTGLLTAATVLSFVETRQGRLRGAALVFVLLSLTRPEGVFFFSIMTAAACAGEMTIDRSWSSAWRRHAKSSLLFAVLFGTYVAWRAWYYGHLVPNTFYAKVTGGGGQVSSGLGYFWRSMVAAPPIALALILPLGLVATRRDQLRSDWRPAVIYAVLLGHAIYAIGVGGDSMAFARFFVPVLPLSCVLVSWTIAAMVPIRWRGGVLAAVFLVTVSSLVLSEAPYVAFVADHDAAIGERVGKWFRETLEDGALIAVNPAGAIPYYSDLPAIDMLGLTDETIARRPVYIVSTGWAGHRRGWGRYVLSRRPRVILWYNNAGGREPQYLGDHELAEDPYFRFFYRPRAATLAGDAGATARRPSEWLLGLPFGSNQAGEAYFGNLAVHATFHDGAFSWTELHPAPIALSYFERDRRDDELWAFPGNLGPDVKSFVHAVAERWRAAAAAAPPADPGERAEVENICTRAEERIRAGDYDSARNLLATAAARNQRARSPVPYQYLANLGVITSDLFVAVAAQKEALRLAPGNPLYEENLLRLLMAPYSGRR